MKYPSNARGCFRHEKISISRRFLPASKWEGETLALARLYKALWPESRASA
jgi:hypothetical protein